MRQARTPKSIPLSKPHLDDTDEEQLRAAIHSGWLTQNGTEVKLMEDRLDRFYFQKTKRIEFSCKSTSNGTTALHLALIAAGVTEDSEVIIPNFAYAAVANSVLYCHATPVLVDVDFENWNIDTSLVLKSITKKTKAVVLVDNYGNEADYLQLRSQLEDRIVIIRDACESFPFVNPHYPLLSNDLVTNSFYANKIITSGEGGSIFGPPALIEKIAILKNQGVEIPGSFQHSVLGYNYRISNLHAALFNSQWNKLEMLIKRRQEIFSRYEDFFSINFPKAKTNAFASPWLFTVNFPNQEASELRNFLKLKQIETRPGFTPFHKYPYLAKFIKSKYSISESLSKGIISLPTFPELSNGELNYILESIMDYKNVRQR
jgi:perosamine synthetase